MNFSDLIPHSNIATFSKAGDSVAIANGFDVQIYDTNNLNVLVQYSFPDIVSQIKWSNDGKYIIVALNKKGIAYVKSLEDSEWNCKIDEGIAGLMYARWVPDSRQVITVSDFQLRLTIWSLVDEKVSYIKSPKHHDKGLSFTSNGKFMALAERNDCKDYIGIYYCGDWKLMNHFQVETTDLADLKWAKDDTAIIVWDTPIECRLLVYSATQGLIAQHIPYENALGIRSVGFSLNGQFLAAGAYDQKVRIYNHISWKEITEFEHKTMLSEDEDIHIYSEEEYKQGSAYNFEEEVTSRYKMVDLPIKLSVAKSSNKENSPISGNGVSIVAWSHDAKFLATKNDNTPNCVWVWDISTLSLSVVLIHFDTVKSIDWSGKSNHLVIATGSPRIFIWSINGASVCDIPLEGQDFNVTRVKWNPDGKSILIQDRSNLLIAYPHFTFLEENEGEAEEEDQKIDE